MQVNSDQRITYTQTWRTRTICLARSRGVRGHSTAAFGRSLHLSAHSSASSERCMPGAKQRYVLAHSGYARTKLSCFQSNIFVRTQLCFVLHTRQLRFLLSVYFEALIANMMMKITANFIFKVKT